MRAYNFSVIRLKWVEMATPRFVTVLDVRLARIFPFASPTDHLGGVRTPWGPQFSFFGAQMAILCLGLGGGCYLDPVLRGVVPRMVGVVPRMLGVVWQVMAKET